MSATLKGDERQRDARKADSKSSVLGSLHIPLFLDPDAPEAGSLKCGVVVDWATAVETCD